MKFMITLSMSLLSFTLFAKEITPVNKYATIYNKKLSDKILKKHNYKMVKRKPSTYELSETEERELLIRAGLEKYIEQMDSLDKKIFIHRLQHYIPRKLIEYYPEIPANKLREAQKKMQ